MKAIWFRFSMILTCLFAAGCLLNPGTPCAGRTRILDLGEGVSMSFAWCPPGEFVMGDQPNGPEGYALDQRVHRVRLTKGFWIGRYEVTRRQWKRIYGDTGYSDPFLDPYKHSTVKHDDEEPIENLEWKDVVMFIEKLNNMKTKGEIAWTGKHPVLPGRFRLPTEAE